ncbi:CidA/LrgA family protein [Serratia sp. UGAL515B_01]|uniref:CidA/LrgA family protein n=1 Tax=Serratia sp. UGAL515B_01 TaxID=2986763 RepID=UPI002954E19C|nr:CidA/LrgA family protein [Serratia sp. UGAL515B_01]WON78125.1 CidA/LrgA family protein [Serratia sp. UGAL515B_01]
MGKLFTVCWKYIRAIALIYLSLFIGNTVAALLPIAIPGSIIGMIVLFALLSSQLLPAKWVKPGCQLFIRYMVLLFVPIGVGVMKYYDQIVDDLAPLVVSCLISTLMVFVVVGYSSHYFHRERPVVDKTNSPEEK